MSEYRELAGVCSNYTLVMFSGNEMDFVTGKEIR